MLFAEQYVPHAGTPIPAGLPHPTAIQTETPAQSWLQRPHTMQSSRSDQGGGGWASVHQGGQPTAWFLKHPDRATMDWSDTFART